MTRVGVFGAAGYGGIDLIRMLLQHPEIQITYLGGHTTVGQKLSEIYPFLIGTCDIEIEESCVDVAAGRADLLFFALPHATGTEMVAEALIEHEIPVIDFSADFRLHDVAEYEANYEPHPCPELLTRAVYGLPELHREAIEETDLLAVPGCYPTGAILALAPAVKHGLIQSETIIVDSKSGVSGAGRSKLTLDTHFAEVNESVHAYSVARHRHIPEMNQELSALGDDVSVTFTPHLVPITRGILSTCYGTLRADIGLAEALDAYCEMYDPEPFIRVLDEGELPRTKDTVGSNRCHIGLAVDEANGRLIAVSAVDNLTKGLAGAAVQCMNLMLSLPETMGLEFPGLWP